METTSVKTRVRLHISDLFPKPCSVRISCTAILLYKKPLMQHN
uniref:Uncharacterized protein n=1 Tax=Rhizophora mucronata TaxID=61149 RepID=A0A2P2QYI6_RHIMU